MKKQIWITFISLFIIQHSLFSQTWQRYDSLRSIYQQKRIYDTAIVYAEKAMLFAKEKVGENDTVYAKMLTTLFDLNYNSGNYKKAQEYGEKDLEIRKTIQGEKNPDYANSLGSLALLYKTLGNYSKAEILYLQTIEIRKEVLGEKHPVYARTLNNLALLYLTIGNYSKAEPLFLQSKEIRKEVFGEKHPDYLNSINNLAGLYKYIGNYSKAEPLYKQVIEIRKEILGENSPDFATSLNNLALLYYAIGDYSKAEPLLINAKEIDKKALGEKHPNYAVDLDNLGGLYDAMMNYKSSESLYIEAKNIRKEVFGINHPDYAHSLNNLAVLYKNMGNYSTSEILVIESKNICRKILGEKHPYYITSISNLAELYEAMGNSSIAEPLYLELIKITSSVVAENFAFLSEKEKEMYFKTQARRFDSFYSFASKRKSENIGITKDVYNTVVKNKGLLLKSSTAMRTALLSCKDTNLIADYKKWVGLKKEISKLNSTEISKRKKNPEELEQQANAIEKDLVRGSQVFSDFEKIQNLTWENIRNSLKSGEAAVEFLRFRDVKKNDTTIYCALIITPQSQQPEMIQLCNEKDLEFILGTNNKNNLSYINSIYGTNQITKDRIYKLIWQPLEKYLDGVKTIYYSPDGLLHKISFLSIGKGMDLYLCDNYALHQLSTTGKVTMQERFTMNKDITTGLYGGIDYTADSTGQEIWKYLPGTKSETDKIEQIFKSKKFKTNYLYGKNAKEKEFKEKAILCDLLHIATHGFFYPEPVYNKKEEEKKISETPKAFRGGDNDFGVWQFVMSKNPLMRSGLVFAGANNVWNQKYIEEGEDGVLTAQEVTQLDLQKTQLLVMSACETGLGDIKGSEGVYGLQRAFKMAGVKFLIMSLWQVPDKETSEFMTKFYDKLLSSKDIHKSFNETQTEMRKKYDPFYWAAFVLIE